MWLEYNNQGDEWLKMNVKREAAVVSSRALKVTLENFKPKSQIYNLESSVTVKYVVCVLWGKMGMERLVKSLF